MNELKVIDESDVEVQESNMHILMSKEEADKLTKDIQSTTTALYLLLKRAHDEKAWVAMGYKSWTEYIENEFEFSRARSYQLINQANVIEEINEASGVPLYITEREARDIKKRLPEITEKLKEVKKEDLSEEEAKDKAIEIIKEEQIDKANGGSQGEMQRENYEDYEEKEDNSAMEEWKPEGIDMEKMKNMLSDEDKFFFNNLINTLKIFESMPSSREFGQRIKESSEEKKELIKLSEHAFSWITQLLDELE